MTDYHEIAARLFWKHQTDQEAVVDAAKQISKMQICIDALRQENNMLRDRVLMYRQKEAHMFYPEITLK